MSPKFQVVIPRRVREILKLKSGQFIQAFAYKGRIELVPIRTAKAMRGFVRGVDSVVERDGDRL